MKLSDLYGRIGQILREQGDAPIGRFISPAGSQIVLEGDWIKPIYVEPTIQTLQVEKTTIKCCDITIWEK